jgi:two-component system, LytTR family, sensor kinase
VVSAVRVVVLLLALSFGQYVLTYWTITHGQVAFYALGEHILLFAYCAASYAACRLCDRAFAARRWQAYVTSFVVACVATSALFVAARAMIGGATDLRMIGLNLPLVLLSFHAVIAGTYFAARHIDAVAARARAEHAAEHAELRQLQQQVDPHFLFNNLNILTALIRQSPAEAEQFSHHLARLYRHLVAHNRTEWVELDDEVAFVESYLHVLAARFGGAYRMTLALPRRSRYVVIPGALQELLGNIVKHNHASDAEPIDVALRIDADTLIAESGLRPKRHAGPASGHGLTLLDERYRRLTGRAVEWAAHGDRFVVRVPLVSAR